MEGSDTVTKPTEVECSGHFQTRALAKVVHCSNAELVTGLLCDPADRELSAGYGSRAVTLHPSVGAQLLLLHHIARDGHWPVSVRWRPAQYKRRVGLILHHRVDWGVWRVLSWSWCAKEERLIYTAKERVLSVLY